MTNLWWDTLMRYKCGRVLNTLSMRYNEEIPTMTYLNHIHRFIMRYLDEIQPWPICNEIVWWDTNAIECWTRFLWDTLMRCFKEIPPWHTRIHHEIHQWDITMSKTWWDTLMRYLTRDTSVTCKNSSWDSSMRYNHDQLVMTYFDEIQPWPTCNEILWWDTNSVECWTHFLWDTMMRYLLWHTSMTYKNSSWDTPMRYNHDQLVMRYFDEIL